MCGDTARYGPKYTHEQKVCSFTFLLRVCGANSTTGLMQALDKIRFESLTDKSKMEAQPELFIHIIPDKTNNTLTIIDSGIGMTKAGTLLPLACRCFYMKLLCLDYHFFHLIISRFVIMNCCRPSSMLITFLMVCRFGEQPRNNCTIGNEVVHGGCDSRGRH